MILKVFAYGITKIKYTRGNSRCVLKKRFSDGKKINWYEVENKLILYIFPSNRTKLFFYRHLNHEFPFFCLFSRL